MKKIQKQQYDALAAFKNYCDAHSIVWTMLIGFATACTALGAKIQAILNMEEQQQQNNKGVAKNKTKVKELMAGSAVIVAQAIQGYAKAVGDMITFDLMSMSYTSLIRSKNSEAISMAQKVLNTANKITVTMLKPYGISQAVLDSHTSAISDYKGVQSSTKQVVTDKGVYTRNLETLVKEGSTIMRSQLLKIGRQYITSNPDFYAGLVNSAKVNTAVVHTKLKLTVSIAEDFQNALPGCTVAIEGTALTGETSAKGKCTISSVPEGKQNIIISKLNYTTLRKEQVAFSRGKSTTFSVLLSPAHDVPTVVTAKSKVTA